MKKYLLVLLLVLVAPWLAYAQRPIPFTLSGTIGKLDAPAKIYMLRDGNFSDSTALKDGKFELIGTTDAPKEVMLVLVRSGHFSELYSPKTTSVDRTSLFLEQGPIMLTSADSLQNAKITGSALTTEYQQMWSSLKPTTNKYKLLSAQSRTATEEQRKSPEFIRCLKAQDLAVTKERNQQLAAYVNANPNSLVSLYAVNQIMISPAALSYSEVAPLYEALTPTVRNSPDGKRYGERLRALKTAPSGK